MATATLPNISPEDIKELKEIPHGRCATCGRTLAELRRPFLDLLEGGITADAAFEELGLPRYCCRMNLAHPGMIPEGKFYYNSAKYKVEIVGEDTEELRRKFTIRSTPQTNISLSTVIQGGTQIALAPAAPALDFPRLPVETKIAKKYPSISTASLPDTSISSTENQPPEEIVEEITTGKITADFLPEGFEEQISQMKIDSMLGSRSAEEEAASEIPGRSNIMAMMRRFAALPPALSLTEAPEEEVPVPETITTSAVMIGEEAVLPGQTIRPSEEDVISTSKFLPIRMEMRDPETGKIRKFSRFVGI